MIKIDKNHDAYSKVADIIAAVFGFGAIINAPRSTEASMCFNLNFSEDPNIYGLDNIKRAYHECIENDKLTFFPSGNS